MKANAGQNLPPHEVRQFKKGLKGIVFLMEENAAALSLALFDDPDQLAVSSDAAQRDAMGYAVS